MKMWVVIVCILKLCCMEHEYSYEELLEKACSKEIVFSKQDDKGRTFLHRAIIARKSPEFISDILRVWDAYNGIELFGGGINRQDKYKRAALHDAVIYSTDDIIYRLLATQGLKVELDHDEFLDIFPTSACLVDLQDIDGKTPIHWAMLKQRDPKVLQALVKLSTNLSLYDNSGHTALHKAALHGFIPGVKVLVEHGQSCNVPDKQGKTPLLYTLEHCIGPIKDLVKLGANPNLQDEDGNTPLHKAVKEQKAAWIKEFVLAGAIKSIKNKEGKTPYDLATGESLKFLENY